MTRRRRPERSADTAVPRVARDALAAASPQIRGPIDTLLGVGALLSQTPLSPAQQQYVDVLRSAAGSLAALLDDLFDLTKTTPRTRTLREERFWLPDVVDRVVDAVRALAVDKGLDLRVHVAAGVPRALIGDPTRLQQVLVNLMVNAIKYTEVGAVSLDVDGGRGAGSDGGDDDDDDDADRAFAVCDTGPGIPRHQVERIFEAWSRLPEHGHIDGVGLGLTVSRRLVDAMGGSIDVDSHTGDADHASGSVFRVRLTLPVAREATTTTTVAVRALRFLVIGERAVFDEVEGALAAWSPHVAFAGDEVEGERMFHTALGKNDPFHIVVLDAELPWAGAIAFGATLRGHATVIVALRQSRVAAIGNLVEEIGAWPLLLPATTSTLYATLERALDPLARLAPLADDLPDLGGRVVHVVADDPDARALLSAFLDRAGLAVVVHDAVDVALAAVKADAERVGLVVCDGDLDDDAAARVAAALKHDADTRDVPVVALRADDDARVSADFDAVLKKPFTLHALVNLVRRHARTAPTQPPLSLPQLQLRAGLALAKRDYKSIEDLARRLPRDLGKRLVAAAKKKDDAALRELLRDLTAPPPPTTTTPMAPQAAAWLDRRARDARDIADAVVFGRYDVVAFLAGKMVETATAARLPQVKEVGARLQVAARRREGRLVLDELQRLQALLGALGSGR